MNRQSKVRHAPHQRDARRDGRPSARGLVQRGAVVARMAGNIAWVGAEADLPAAFTRSERLDLDGRWSRPALIDCHTHLVHGGNRAHEFEMRLDGATYEEIARAGGGIVSTVARHARRRRGRLVAAGAAAARCADRRRRDDDRDQVGLRPRRRQPNCEMLRAARRLAAARGRCTCATTFLGAHAAAAGIRRRRRTPIIDRWSACRRCAPLMPRAWPMRSMASARASPSRPQQIARVFDAAQALGLPVKLHAEQLSNLGGARAGRALRRAVGRSSGICRRGRRGRDGGGGHGRGASCPAPSTSCARRRLPPVAAFRAARRADGGRDRLQPRHLAADLAAAGDEHGATLFRMTVGRMPCRRHPRGRARARPAGRDRHAGAGQGGRSRGLGRRAARPNSSTASASIRLHARIFGGDLMTAITLTPGAAHARRTGARSTRVQLPARCDRSLPAPRSTAAAAVSRAQPRRASEPVYGVNTGFGKLASVRIAPDDMATLQRNLILSHCCGVGEPLPDAVRRLMMALKLAQPRRAALRACGWRLVALHRSDAGARA